MFERLKRNNRDLSLARQEECFFSCVTDCHVARQSVLDRPVPRCGALEIWLAMRLDGVGIPRALGPTISHRLQAGDVQPTCLSEPLTFRMRDSRNTCINPSSKEKPYRGENIKRIGWPVGIPSCSRSADRRITAIQEICLFSTDERTHKALALPLQVACRTSPLDSLVYASWCCTGGILLWRV